MNLANRKSYVYILSNDNNTVVYVGCTIDINKRLYLHRNRLLPGFTKKYNLTKLVYFEEFDNEGLALDREKQIKKYRREKKNNLIEKTNSGWLDQTNKVILC